MTKKRRSIISHIIISVLLIATVVGYHYLQYNYYFIDRPALSGIVNFVTRDRIYRFLYYRIFQYILIGSMYVALFCLIHKIVKFYKKMKPIVVLFGILFSLHIYIDDLLLNYSAYNHRYFSMAWLSFSEFMCSDVWSRYISKYSFAIVFINFGFMCALLMIFVFINAFRTRGGFFDGEKIDKKEQAEGVLRRLIVDYDEVDLSSLRIIELYLNEKINYKMVVEFIEMLPPNNMEGFRNLMLLEETIAELHPVIDAGVRRAKETKYKRIVEKLEKKREEKEEDKAEDKTEYKTEENIEDEIKDRIEDKAEDKIKEKHEDNVIEFDFTRKN